MVEYFKGEEFEVRYELIAAHNATGKIKNDEADRVVRVLRGQLFILQDGNIVTLREGQAYSLPKGTEYEMCSDNSSDVEVLLCQGSNYEKNVKIIEESEISNVNPVTVIQDRTVPPRRKSSKAMEAAQMISSEKMARQAARNPAKKKLSSALPGQNEPGANLQPMGDPGEGTSE
jgi:mannose-6-phosphate isomerase-like protein (cupin superfamily)